MPLDLSQSIGEHIIATGAQAFQTQMTNLAAGSAFVTELARLQAQQRFGELDIVESRAASGLIATPIASPTTQEAQK